MAYNTDISNLKLICEIDEDDETCDAKLVRAQSMAHNRINEQLKQYVGTDGVPLTGTNVTEFLKEIEDTLAAGLFKQMTTTPVEGRDYESIFTKAGMEMLETFLEANYKAKGTRRSAFLVDSTSEFHPMRIDGGNDDFDGEPDDG